MNKTPKGLMCALGIGLLGLASQAQALSSCTVGQRVMAPGDNLATVVAVQGSGCRVRKDGVTYTDMYAAFMLKSASPEPVREAPVEAAALPATGRYQCSGGAAGKLKLNFTGSGRYANEQGKSGAYKLLPGGKLAFTSGPWEGFFAKVLPHGRVGLTSSEQSTMYYMTCDRK